MDISRADLPLLVSLAALLEERSVSGAATRLGLSQPALSAQLARLRDLFGDPLLAPSGRKMVLTARAQGLQAPLARLLAELGDLVRQRATFDPASARKTFRIAAPDYMHAVVNAPLARRVEMAAPNVRIAWLIANADTKASWAEMEADRIDFLVTSVRLTPPDAKAVILYEERFVLAQRKGHPRGARKPTLTSFCGADHLLISTSGGSFTGPVDDALKQKGLSRRVALSAPSFLVAPVVLKASDYVCVMPKGLADLYADDLDIFPLPFELPGFPVLLSWHPKRQGDPAHEWLKALTVG